MILEDTTPILSLIASKPVSQRKPPNILEKGRIEWDNPTMTVIADNKKRVTLPDAKPGDRFDLQFTAEGSVVLRKLEPVKRSVSYVKKKGLLLARTNQPISAAETRAGIDKFAL